MSFALRPIKILLLHGLFIATIANAQTRRSDEQMPPADPQKIGQPTPASPDTREIHPNVNNYGLTTYNRLTVAGRSVLVRPEDAGWVRRGAESAVQRRTGTTQPSDLFARLEERRDGVLAQMLVDLPSLRPSQIDRLIDDELLPALRRLAAYRYRPVFLVTAEGPLKDEIRQGWSHPSVRWNRVADRLAVDRGVKLSPEDENAESLIIVMFDPGQGADERSRLLSQYFEDTDRQVGQALSTRATGTVLVKIADFIAREALSALPRAEDQVWLPVGLSNVLAARYVALFHGSPQREFIEALVTRTAGQSVNALQVDLLAPLPTQALKPEAVAPYMDARRRKAIAVTYILIRDAGEKSVMPLINAVERLRPADGRTLAETVKSVCGVDLLPQLRAK